MNKRVIITIAITLAVSMAFTACGNNPEPSSESVSAEMAEVSEEVSSQLSVESSSEAESIDSQSEESASDETEEADSTDISVYAATMQEMLDALSDIYGDAMKIETSTESNNILIITYTLLSDSLGLTSENIAESMKTEEAKMENMVSQMESEGIPSPIIIVKWIDTDGSELFNQEYK